MRDLLGKDLAQSSDVALKGYLRDLLQSKYRLGQRLEWTERRIEKVRDELARRGRPAEGTANDAAERRKLAVG